MRVAAPARESEPRTLPAGPPVALSSGPLGAVQAADREIGRQTALRARAVAAFASARPSSADRRPGEPGSASAATRAARPEILAPVSEWAAQELTVALSISQPAAQALLERSLVLVQQLPGTLAALESGLIGPQHLWPFLERVATVADPEVRARIESSLLAWLTGRVTSPAQLAAKARRLVLLHDAQGAAQRLAQAVRRRGVFTTAERVDGMNALTAVLSTPEAQACLQALGQYADSVEDDPVAAGQVPRTRAEKMADCLVDLVLRPGAGTLPPVQAQLTLVASVETLAGGDQAGEVGGEVVPAVVVRELARRLGLVPEDRGPDRGAPDVPGADGGTADAELDDEGSCTWLGADPPPEHLERAFWERDAEWARWMADAWAAEGPEPPVPAPPVGTWAAADAAVEAASARAEAARRALLQAGRAVAAAERNSARGEAAWAGSPAGRMTRAADTLAALASAAPGQRQVLADLLTRTGGGGLHDRPRIAVVEALSGTLLALTDAPALQRIASCGRSACARRRVACTHDLSGRPGLRSPAATGGYRPSAALDRYVRARDRRCRFPGCRYRVPTGGELDHDRPWPAGPTAAGNLVGYCTRHHRGKHQAPGWVHRLHPDGRLSVTTPTGLTAVTAPPPY